MANQWFKFKQFTIYQDQCAMKVGTDGVILGAWVSVNNARKILDVGTGTGLLSLMVAQRSGKSKILAVEIDEASAKQAFANVNKSIYKDQITVKHIDFIKYYDGISSIYDLIICNPPYFNNSERSENANRSMARHDDTLPLESLMEGAQSLLKDEGVLGIVVPEMIEQKTIEMAANHSLFPSRILDVFPLPGKPKKRICIEFSFKRRAVHRDSLIVEENGRHQYSEKYIDLTKDFYLF